MLVLGHCQRRGDIVRRIDGQGKQLDPEDPRRFFRLGLEQALLWIWDPDNAHRPLPDRVRASFEVISRLPRVLRGERFSAHEVRRVPEWR